MAGMFSLSTGGTAAPQTQAPPAKAWNAQQYIQANPDVAKWIQDTQAQSNNPMGSEDLARQHYDQYGKAEGRQGEFDAPASTNSVDGAPDAQQSDPTGLYSILHGLKDKMDQPYDYSGAPKAPTIDDASRQQYADKLYSYDQTRLDKRFGDEKQQFDQRMANQGVDIGSQRYKKELEAWESNRNQAYRDSSENAFRDAGDEQNRVFGLESQARSNYIGEQDSLRDRPFKEAGSILTPGVALRGQDVQKSIADQTDKTQRYGIDTSAKSAKYGVDVGADTANKDRSSNEMLNKAHDLTSIQIANINSDTSKGIADLQAQIQREGYVSQEGINNIRIKADQDLQNGRISADEAAAIKAHLNDMETLGKTQKFTGGQNSKDRQVQREQIAAQLRAAAMAHAKSGGDDGGGITPELIDQILSVLSDK